MKIKNIISLCIRGLGIGFPVTVICMWIMGGFNSVVMEFGVWAIASALFGLVSLIFTSQRLPYPLALILHCLMCLTITVSACGIMGYANSVFEILKAVGPMFFIAYALIYAVCFSVMKFEEKQANKALKER